MNQTQKRLSIIKLAISITDIETIQLQLAKLRLLRDDTQIQKIIEVLESESYAQAQSLIQEYIDTPIQEIHQRVPREKKEHIYTQREQELIEEFNLFFTENGQEAEDEILDINEYLQTSTDTSSKKNDEFNFDKLLRMDEDAEEENEKEVFTYEESQESVTELQPLASASQDNLYIEESLPEEEEKNITPSYEEPLQEEMTESILTQVKEEGEVTTEMTTAAAKTFQPSQAQEVSEDTTEMFDKSIKYQPIFSIKEQFLEASQKYPMVVNSTQPYNSVTEWIDQISHETGYTKIDVEKTVINALKLIENGDIHKPEAAELLLLSGLTEDEFGQLILARELFKGRLFEKNIADAFKRIEQLAAKEYPEAICDLAQFYEHGIATKKNKKRAKELYEKAMHFGINRAKRHFERLSKEGGLFSF